MNYTENYQLPQWVESDRILMEDFNSMATKVDQAIGSLENTLTGVANAAGNCEMEVLTYTGTGTYGISSPTQITFTQKPDIFFVAGDLALVIGHGETSGPILACKDVTTSGSFISTATASWSGAQISFTNNVNSRYQMNSQGKVYWVLGLRQNRT